MCCGRRTYVLRFSDLCSLVMVLRVRAIPVALGVRLEPAAESVESKVVTATAEDPRVESSLCATIR